MPEPNPNRELDADQVVHLFAKNLPHLVKGLGADRNWLWWSGAKPEERDRAAMKEIGFSFTPRPHVLPDGRQALWFHSCGGVVMRRRKSAVSSRHQLTAGAKKVTKRPSPRFETTENNQHDEVSELGRLAALL